MADQVCTDIIANLRLRIITKKKNKNKNKNKKNKNKKKKTVDYKQTFLPYLHQDLLYIPFFQTAYLLTPFLWPDEINTY